METAQSAEISYGSAELAFILTSFDPSTTTDSARAMGMDLKAVSVEVRAAGASSLMAKGLLEIVDGQTRLTGTAEDLGYTLAAAARWTELGFLASQEELLDGALVVSAPEATILMQPRALGSWTTAMKDPAHSDAEAVQALIEALLANTADGVVFLSTRSDGQVATLFVRSRAAGLWEIVEGDAAADRADQTFDQSELSSILGRLLHSERPQ